jgi:hypothetical protein
MNIIKAIKHDFLQILPPTIFFLISFSLLFATRQLILREYGLSLPGFGVAVIGAMLVGKVVLMVDKLPFVDRYPDKPLIYNACWKSLIYFLAALLVRCLKPIAPLLIEHESLVDATRHFVSTTVWPEFWLVQMWLGVLFLVYCSLRELVRVLGSDRVIQMFFGGHRAS